MPRRGPPPSPRPGRAAARRRPGAEALAGAALAALLAAAVLGAASGCAPRLPSLVAASDGAVEVARGLEAALWRHDGWAAVSLCDRVALERAVGPTPHRLVGGGDLEIVEWRPAPRSLAPGLGALAGTYTEVRAARVRVAGLRGGGGRLSMRVHLRAFGRVADGRTREDDGFLRLDLRRNVGGRWRIVAAVPEDLVTTLRREPAYRDVTRSAGFGRAATPPPRGPLVLDGPPAGAGLAAADLDGDGRVDLVVPGPGGCRLRRNRGDGRFGDLGVVPCAADTRAVAAVDLDGDGIPDLVTAAPAGVAVWRGEGGFGFHRVPAPPVPGAAAVVPVDVDGDGYPDLVVPRGAAGVALLKGGPEGFVDATAAAGLAAAGPVAAACAGDVDHDGRPELFLVPGRRPGRLLRNRGGRFSPVAGGPASPALATGCLFADVDGDGHTDLLVTAAYDDAAWLAGRADLGLGPGARLREGAVRADLARALAGTALWLGHGDGTFRRDARPRLAAAGWATGALAVDGDGGLDLLVACGLRSAGPRDLTPLVLTRALPRLLAGGGATFDPGAGSVAGSQPQGFFVAARGRFVPAADTTLRRLALDARAAVAADVDGDGLLDLVLRGADGGVHLLRGDTLPRSFLRLRLLARTGAPALGAQVEATVAGRPLLRHLLPAGPGGTGPAEIHLSLGRALRLPRLRVRWPDGSVQEVLDLPARRVATIRQGSDRVDLGEVPRWRLPGLGLTPAPTAPPGGVTPPASSPAAPTDRPHVPAAGTAAPAPAPPLPAVLRELLRRDLGLRRPGGDAARPPRGAAATLVYFTDGPGCRREVARLEPVVRRLGPRVALAVVAPAGGSGACPAGDALLEAPRGTLGPLLPAVVLYDGDGRPVWVQLGLVDPAVLEREARRLLAAPAP